MCVYIFKAHDSPVKFVQFFQEVLLSSSDSEDEASNIRLKSLEEVLQGITLSQLEVNEDSQGKSTEIIFSNPFSFYL